MSFCGISSYSLLKIFPNWMFKTFTIWPRHTFPTAFPPSPLMHVAPAKLDFSHLWRLTFLSHMLKFRPYLPRPAQILSPSSSLHSPMLQLSQSEMLFFSFFGCEFLQPIFLFLRILIILFLILKQAPFPQADCK